MKPILLNSRAKVRFFHQFKYENLIFFISRWDRYLGMTAAMTQVPLTFASDGDGDLWFVELRYHLGLTKLNKDVAFTNGWRTPGSIRNSVVMLTVGYKCDL